MAAEEQTLTTLLQDAKYPPFIRNHPIVRKNIEVQKVFPLIGLDNCEESVDIDNSKDIGKLAILLVSQLVQQLDYATRHNCPDRRGTFLASACRRSYKACVVRNGGKISLIVPRNISMNGKVVFKKGESLFKAYSKLSNGLNYLSLGNILAFKEFSSANIPNKSQKLVFSSDGKDGLWDIATMSMRGISSCQSWSSEQAKHLIGSILDPFTGIIYLTSGNKCDVPSPGAPSSTKMTRRCVVRLIVDSKSGKESLLLERMYPSHDKSVSAIFTEFLKRKTDKRYDIIDRSLKRHIAKRFYAPCSSSVRELNGHEYPYCDSGVMYRTDDMDDAGKRAEMVDACRAYIIPSIAMETTAELKLMSLRGLTDKQRAAITLMRTEMPYSLSNQIQGSAEAALSKVDNRDRNAFNAISNLVETHLKSWVKDAIAGVFFVVERPYPKAAHIPRSKLDPMCGRIAKHITKLIAQDYPVEPPRKNSKAAKEPLYLKLLSC